VRKGLILLGVLIIFGQNANSADLAEVNGKAITDRDFDHALGGMNEYQKRELMSNAFARRKVLDQLIANEVLSAEARKNGLDKTEKFRLAEKSSIDNILSGLLIESKVSQTISDNEVKNFYEKNKSLFSTVQINIRQIVLTTEEKAASILGKLKKTPGAFGELAKEHSIDPSSKFTGGDMGYITRDKLPKQMRAKVFAAKKGSILGPIQSELGFHIILVVDRKAGATPPFSDVHFRVRQLLLQEKIDQFVTSLKSKYKIKVFQK